MAITFKSETIQDYYDTNLASVMSALGTDAESLDERVASFEYVVIPDSSDSGEDTWDYPFDRDGLKRQFLNELIALLLTNSTYRDSGLTYNSNNNVFNANISFGNTDNNFNTLIDGGWDPYSGYLSSSGIAIYDHYSTMIDMIFEAGDELANDPTDPFTGTTADTNVATAIPEETINGVAYSHMSIDSNGNRVLVATNSPMATTEKTTVYDTGGNAVDTELSFIADNDSTITLSYDYESFTVPGDNEYTAEVFDSTFVDDYYPLGDSYQFTPDGSDFDFYAEVDQSDNSVFEQVTQYDPVANSYSVMTVTAADVVIDGVSYDRQFTDSDGTVWYLSEDYTQLARDLVEAEQVFDIGNNYEIVVDDNLSTATIYKNGAYEGAATIEQIDETTVEGVTVSYQFSYEFDHIESAEGSNVYITSDGSEIVAPNGDRTQTEHVTSAEVQGETDVVESIDGTYFSEYIVQGYRFEPTESESDLEFIVATDAAGVPYYLQQEDPSGVTQELTLTAASNTVNGVTYAYEFTDTDNETWYVSSDGSKLAHYYDVEGVEGSARRNLSPLNYLYYWMEARIHVLKGQLAYREAVVREIQEDITQANSVLADLEDQVGDVETDNSNTSWETESIDLFELVNSEPWDPLIDETGDDDIHNYTDWQENRTRLNNFIDTRTAQAEDAMLDYQQMLTRYNTAFETMSTIMDKLNTMLESQINNI